MYVRKKSMLGVIGCIISFMALAAAFLSPQIAEAIDPPAKPIEESAVDFAIKLKDAAAAKMRGEAYQAEPKEANPSRYLFPAIIGFGMIGTGFGVGSLIRGEKRSLSAGAITLGITAALVQWSLLFLALIIFVLLIGSILGETGIDLPS